MWERIYVILRKEFIQALREPRMRVLLFVPPIVQLLVFGARRKELDPASPLEQPWLMPLMTFALVAVSRFSPYALLSSSED